MCLGAALLALPAEAQVLVPRQASGAHATLELIAAAPGLPPTGETWAALRFVLEPGWHIYWQNPGDSGGPPTVIWTPSAGLAPGNFEWPLPERIPFGQLVNYGYHGDVVLPFVLRTANAAGPARLEARVNYLACKDVCVAGKARVALAFPLDGEARAAVPAWKASIDEARSRVPAAAPSSWRVEGREEGDALVVTVTTGRREPGGTFFPVESGIVDDAAPQHPTPLERGVRFTLKKSEQLTSTPQTLRGIVALDTGTAHAVTVPLARTSPSKGRTP